MNQHIRQITFAFLTTITICGDVISDWNKVASAFLASRGDIHVARGMAMVHVAQFEAVNAVQGGYVPYLLSVSAPGASASAAASQAAYTVLTNVYRGDFSSLNSALKDSLAGIPGGPAKDAGIELGRFAADEVIRMRAADNPDLPITPPVSAAVGKWRISPPNSSPGVYANTRYITPWTMRTPSQFRPGPPPALTSEQYAIDFAEASSLGALNSTNRTTDQSDAARFHSGNDQAFLRPALERFPLPLIESARIVALFYMAYADSADAFLEAQYAYSTWRPYTAIRLAGTDGNDATTPDPNWLPMISTPNHPEYPSGTCTTTATAIVILTNFFGDNFNFSAVYTDRSPRLFTNLSSAIPDAITARVAAGAHFRFACVAGVELGTRIAQHALANLLRPIPGFARVAQQASGQFQLSLATAETYPIVVETSTDLLFWTPWATNQIGTLWLTDPNTGEERLRFYRAFRTLP